MQAEVETRQVANALLASHRKETAASGRRLKEQYELKLREKQKQLNSLQDRLQVKSTALLLLLHPGYCEC